MVPMPKVGRALRTKGKKMEKQVIEAVVSYFIADKESAKSAVNRLMSGLEKSGSVSYKLGAVAGSLAKWQEVTEFSAEDSMGAEALVEFAKYFATLAKESAPKTPVKAVKSVSKLTPRKTKISIPAESQDGRILLEALKALVENYAGR